MFYLEGLMDQIEVWLTPQNDASPISGLKKDHISRFAPGDVDSVMYSLFSRYIWLSAAIWRCGMKGESDGWNGVGKCYPCTSSTCSLGVFAGIKVGESIGCMERAGQCVIGGDPRWRRQAGTTRLGK
jgi:hypothetical protein